MHSHNTGRHIQSYGHAVPTPSIQRLAEEGVLFRQAFATAPTCSPSRASFLTGQSPHRTGMLGLSHRGFGLSDPERHILYTLRDAGYFTAQVGIEHINRNERASDCTSDYDQVIRTARGMAAEVGPKAAEWLRNAPQEPFFMVVGLNETHIPFPDPDPGNHAFEDERYCTPPPALPDTPELRRETARYKAGARAMDSAYGQILDVLDTTGLAGRTLVFCFADHGLQFPRHICNLEDRGLEVYCIARGPMDGPASVLRGGKVVDGMVTLMDLFPTVCDTARIEHPHWLEGKSLLPLARGEVDSLHEEIFGEVTFHAAPEPMRCVRTERYKYIRRYDNRDKPVLPNTDDTAGKKILLEHGWLDQPRYREMLYDLVFDQPELNNIIDRPDMQEVAEDMRRRLDHWMRRTEDPLMQGAVEPPPGSKLNDPDGRSPNEAPIQY